MAPPGSAQHVASLRRVTRSSEEEVIDDDGEPTVPKSKKQKREEAEKAALAKKTELEARMTKVQLLYACACYW